MRGLIHCLRPATRAEVIALIHLSIAKITLIILILTDNEPGGFPMMLIGVGIITRLVVITPSSRPMGRVRRIIWVKKGWLKRRGSLGLQTGSPLVTRASTLTRYHTRDFEPIVIYIAGFVCLTFITTSLWRPGCSWFCRRNPLSGSVLPWSFSFNLA